MSTHSSILSQSNNDSQTTGQCNGANKPHSLTPASAQYLIEFALKNLNYPLPPKPDERPAPRPDSPIRTPIPAPDERRSIQLGAMAINHLLTGWPELSDFDPAELELAFNRLSILWISSAGNEAGL